ncbi:YIP1 family protein [Sphingobacteriales bacterium UPWRP_1]|nr:hypothetical protein BVG80_01585 [Sphingobacteriales bacterium TSM_CSM]PSJ72939.1 YIP1 family protein [Sphingobacteriales bacterium UPWRP_1]
MKTLNITDDSTNLTDKELFVKIWTSPSRVFQYLATNQYDKYVYILLILAGATIIFDEEFIIKFSNKLPLWKFMGVSLFGAILGAANLYLYACLMGWTGKWVDGQGKIPDLVRVMAYALIPTIIALLVQLVFMAFYGNDIFLSNPNRPDSAMLNLATTFCFVVNAAAILYSAYLLVVGVSTVHKITADKAILNLVMPLLCLGIVAFIIVALFLAVRAI